MVALTINSVPPLADAIAWVQAIEAEWGVNGTRILSARAGSEDDMGCVFIKTDDYDWTVWYQPDGTLYGEA